MQHIDTYRSLFLDYLKNFIVDKEPNTLYKPIAYILHLQGKRLRPVLTLMTSEIFNTDPKKALDAALAIEVFHNFSLVHDDIMDAAPLRRGAQTVHQKWDLNTAILSGDAMLILAYQLFENYDATTFQALAKLFSTTALQVCEGQQYDVDFETQKDVSVAQYIQMIEYKTAVLVGAAMQMGAIIAKASLLDQKRIYEFGKNLGIAFQLQDDYLDAFGDQATFGKQVGGDILENKKTYLYIKALAFSSEEEKKVLTSLFANKDNVIDKVARVKALFLSSGSVAATKQAIEIYTQKAFSTLDTLAISKQAKQHLQAFGMQLMNRTI